MSFKGRAIAVIALAGALLSTQTAVAAADPLQLVTNVVQPAGVPSTRTALTKIEAMVAGTELETPLADALANASGSRIIGDVLSSADVEAVNAALLPGNFTTRTLYAANGYVLIVDSTQSASTYASRLAYFSRTDGMAQVVATATAQSSGSLVNLSAVDADGANVYAASVAAGSNDCSVQCFGAGLSAALIGTIACGFLYLVPAAGPTAGLLCAAAFVVAVGGFSVACPAFASLCDDGPGGLAWIAFACVPGSCTYEAVASNTATLTSTSVHLDYLRAGYLDYDVLYTSFTRTRSVKGLVDNHYFFEGSWATPYYARAATSVLAYGVVGWSNGKYSSQMAGSGHIPY